MFEIPPTNLHIGSTASRMGPSGYISFLNNHARKRLVVISLKRMPQSTFIFFLHLIMQGKHFCCSSRFLCPNLHDLYYHCSFHLAFSCTIQSNSLHLFLYLCSLQMGHFLRMLPSSSSSHVSKNVLFISLIKFNPLIFSLVHFDN